MKQLMRVLTGTTLFVLIAVAITRAQAPPPPTGFTAQVAGTFITLSWNAAPGAGSYIVQVGTAPGASNLFNGNVGNTTSVSGNAPPGTYFARVISVSFGGATSAPSGEAQFDVGGGCVPPGPPQGFLATVSGVRVTLQWSPPLTGGPPTTYIVEAGSSPGLANLFNSPTGGTALSLSVDAPPGTYFARLRAQNGCGTSGVSNEQMIVVGGGGGPCTYAIAPDSINVPLTGGPIQVNVAAQGGCRWQLQSDAFIVPTSNPGGAGSATVGYMVQATGAPRNGQIVLQAIDPGNVTASQVIVRQIGAASCAVTLNPTSQTVPAASGVFEFRVNAAEGCTWTVTPLAGFLSIVSSGQQRGSDGVRYQVVANTAQAARSGVIRVTSSAGFQDFSVTQQPPPPPPVARWRMTQGGVEGDICVRTLTPQNPCILDASASTPAAEITSYEWDLQRQGRPGQRQSGINLSLTLDCSSIPLGSVEFFDVTLTVRTAAGQIGTLHRRLGLAKVACGEE